MRSIETHEDIAEGVAWLRKNDPRFIPALDLCDQLPLRRREEGFASLLHTIVGQQVSVASAAAIWTRLEDAGLTDEAKVADASEDDLRACGLSRQKMRYASALANARVDYPNLRTMAPPDIIKTLTAIPGIGHWTAEIYVMFSLGHPDVFAHGDLALQEGARMLFGLPERPKEKDMRVMAEDWSPWRAVAARALWDYYARIKRREGIG
ncbi:DNA-3-methyladenine glycosylase family protein [Litoreibacter roseus]|uniref:DNA-3-methyladenine glycosylase II n=1 Tax=Litoreibacter roseus TaxID=2601869 RepID=A0A6N6JDJ8_9RHOB|nr:DNA-3-methyladenine glycosylase 2 family protein [Litoreibacter roseus]GFE64266.1 3-methyladenine DNA glycosylase [Litoreibacter roseus]